MKRQQEPPPTWPERLIPPAILLLSLAAALGVMMIPRLRDSASTHAAQAASAQAPPTREYRLVGHRIVNKPIAQIEPGDRVLTRDQNDPHGSIVPGEVVETYQPIADHLRLLTLAMPDGSETELETTDNHPFHVPGRGWVPAGKLRVADEVSTAGEAVAHVQSTAREEHPEGVEVYNFQVEGAHTYFVSAENSTGPPVWVHNAKSCTSGNNKYAAKGHAEHIKYYDKFKNIYTTNKRIDGTDLRPDAWRVFKLNGKPVALIIRELKPGNPRAVSRGYGQLDDYEKAFRKIDKFKDILIIKKVDTY